MQVIIYNLASSVYCWSYRTNQTKFPVPSKIHALGKLSQSESELVQVHQNLEDSTTKEIENCRIYINLNLSNLSLKFYQVKYSSEASTNPVSYLISSLLLSLAGKYQIKVLLM